MTKLKKNVEKTSKSASNQSVESPDLDNKTTNTSNNNSHLISYKIRLLDSFQHPLEISILKNDNGEILFNKVCDELGGIVERDYFGLRFMDKQNQRQWLDLGCSVKKQLAGAHSKALSFRVKHYPGNPLEDFHQEISQYLLYLEIRRDLVQGRLLCPLSELYMIGALILQSEYGDAPDDANIDEPKEADSTNEDETNEETHSYFKNFKIVFNQTKKIEDEIRKIHFNLRGLTGRDAEIDVLKRVSTLPTYGVDPFPVKVITKRKSLKKQTHESTDAGSIKTVPKGGMNASLTTQQDNQSSKSSPAGSSGSVYLGLRHFGLTIYVGLQPSENYNWSDIGRLACDGKDFIVYLKSREEPKELTRKKSKAKPETLTFRCETKAAALALWKWAIDRQSFFTLQEASEAKPTKTINSFFRRSHSYRFIGKSQMELKSIADSCESLPQPAFVRVSSLRRSPRCRDSDFDPLSNRATLPARIRSANGADSATYPATDPPKRPTLDTVTEQTGDGGTPNHQTIMSVANDLRASSTGEAATPIKPAVTAVSEGAPPSIMPIVIDPVGAAQPEMATEENTEVQQRAVHTTQTNVRDSECLRAVKQIDEAIDSAQQSTNITITTTTTTTTTQKRDQQSNGEVSREPSEKRSSSDRVLVYALEAAAITGLVCLGVIVVALETHPTTIPGQSPKLWTEMAAQLRGQQFVATFNEYLYAPLRNFFFGGGREGR